MVAVEMKREVAVANTDGQTGKIEKKEKRRKATQPEREVISIIEEREGGAKTDKMKNKSEQSEHPVEHIKMEHGGKMGAEEEVQKQKKKKGHDGHSAEAGVNGGEVVCNTVKEEGSEGREQRKKKKMKNKSIQSEPPVENIKVEDGEKVGAEEEVLKKAKKKRKASVTCAERTEEPMKNMKKGKKRSSALAEQDGGEGVSVKKELVEDDEGFIIPKVEVGAAEGETVKKKRKKAAKMEGGEPFKEPETLEVKHQVKKKKKKKAEAATQEEGETEKIRHTNNRDEAIDNMDHIEEVKRETKSKKKGLKEKSEKKKGLKEKKRKAPVCAEEEHEVTIVEDREPKKKKKKKKKREAVLSVADEEVLDQPTEVSVESKELLTNVADGMKGKKKERKNPSEIKLEKEEEGDGKNRKKNKKIKVEQCDSEKEQGQEVASHTDVVFLSKKHGNTDEVTINQQRRVALQMEVDKASQPETRPTASGLGQWASAQFDSSEQQHKFLRLMGGFKKGSQPTCSTAGRANMALGKEAQDNVQQALQGQFEQAQSRRMDFNNKGSGLGFTAPSNKKFAIDVNARRSVRFDD